MNRWLSHPLFFLSIYSLGFFFYISFTSLATFFHFLLDHDFSTLEAWLYDRKSLLIGVSKLASLFIIYPFWKLNWSDPSIKVKNIFDFDYSLFFAVFTLFFILLGQSFFVSFSVNRTELLFWEQFLNIFLGVWIYLSVDLFVIHQCLPGWRAYDGLWGKRIALSIILVVFNGLFVYQWSSKIILLLAVYLFIFALYHARVSLLASYLFVFVVTLPLSLVYPLNLFYGRDNCLFFLIPADYQLILALQLLIGWILIIFLINKRYSYGRR